MELSHSKQASHHERRQLNSPGLKPIVKWQYKGHVPLKRFPRRFYKKRSKGDKQINKLQHLPQTYWRVLANAGLNSTGPKTAFVIQDVVLNSSREKAWWVQICVSVCLFGWADTVGLHTKYSKIFNKKEPNPKCTESVHHMIPTPSHSNLFLAKKWT